MATVVELSRDDKRDIRKDLVKILFWVVLTLLSLAAVISFWFNRYNTATLNDRLDRQNEATQCRAQAAADEAIKADFAKVVLLDAIVRAADRQPIDRDAIAKARDELLAAAQARQDSITNCSVTKENP